jgi:hypothetical protein
MRQSRPMRVRPELDLRADDRVGTDLDRVLDPRRLRVEEAHAGGHVARDDPRAQRRLERGEVGA